MCRMERSLRISSDDPRIMPAPASGRSRLLVAIGVAAWIAPVHAGEADIARVRAEYPSAARRLEAAYAEVRGTARVGDPTPGHSGRFHRSTFASGHGSRKVEIVTETKKAGRPDARTIDVLCTGDLGSFVLSRGPKAAAFRVDGVDSNEVDSAQYKLAMGWFLSSSYAVQDVPLAKTLASPGTQLVSAGPVAGRPGLIRIEVRVQEPSRVARTTITLDPGLGWAILDAKTRYEGGPVPSISQVAEYGPPRDGIPTLRAATFDIENFMKSRCDFDRLGFEPTPKSEFTMGHYGLPDLATRPAAGRPRSMVPWLVGLAAAGLAGSFALRRIAARPRTSPA